MPAFTIIIPCYNAAETLAETIASVRAQSVTDWEAVIVDDASTDGSLRLLRELTAYDPRFWIISQPNAGPSVARNRAAALARGRVLAFLDADDLWHPEKLARTARAFQEAPEADAVFARIGFFTDPARPDATISTVRPGAQTSADVIGENPACTLSNLSVRREAFLATGGFDADLRYAEDLEWMNRAVARGLQLWAVNSVDVRYRMRAEGLSADLAAMHAGWRQAVAPYASAVELARAEARHLRYLARRALRTGQAPALARSLALQGLRRAPSAFLGDRHRGPATLAGCLAAPLLPASIRRRAFA